MFTISTQSDLDRLQEDRTLPVAFKKSIRVKRIVKISKE
ncbi:Hypothetical protein DPCES_3581 [Desulfitobacterium hafniense]|uniref:Uncharacterized protein n=1 Tax=Desulfitobacterium hafniense TaxID=49338 RepID=A0A098B535_DESHA|nr:Hypothetical protein DPCES_3581 [Desulfitobacterium hafniense]